MVPKLTIGCFLESIGCFDTLTVQPFKTVFNLFLKPPKYKQSVVSTKQSVVLTQFEKHFTFTKIDNAYALDLIKRWITTLKLPRTKLNQHSNSKHNQGFNILQRVWILQSLNTTWFNSVGQVINSPRRVQWSSERVQWLPNIIGAYIEVCL